MFLIFCFLQMTLNLIVLATPNALFEHILYVLNDLGIILFFLFYSSPATPASALRARPE